MKHKSPAKDLAKALFQVSDKNNVLKEVGDALKTLDHLVSTNSYFRVFLQSKKITGDQKVKILNELLGKDLVVWATFVATPALQLFLARCAK